MSPHKCSSKSDSEWSESSVIESDDAVGPSRGTRSHNHLITATLNKAGKSDDAIRNDAKVPGEENHLKRRRRASTDFSDREAHAVASGDIVPRRRKSATWDQPVQMEKARAKVDNIVPPMPQNRFDSWQEFQTILNDHYAAQHIHFRTRTSEKTTTHNSFEFVADVYPQPLNREDRSGFIFTVLADANASTKNITQYVSDNLGHPISPQQVQNLLRRTLGQSTAEVRVKAMLHAFVQTKGNDVLLVQDQMDITCAVVLQTSVQKAMFEQWGQTLSMDWTHGTNNLGYHLGSLIATTSSGRGVPVLDFFALHETAEIMCQILEFFKAKNKSWQQVWSFVIDKDFVEWRVLEKCFPSTKVLRCQFHTFTYWKKLLQKPKYNMRVSQRRVIEDIIMQMIYRSTESAFLRSCEGLAKYCKDEKCHEILQYFELNWKSCHSMWSNYARNTFFSAGNSTTNRVESNWNQLKMLMGKNTTLDKTVAGILTHQVTVLRQLDGALRRHSTRSRMPDAVPVFIQRVAVQLSDFALEKVQDQWNSCSAIGKHSRYVHQFTQLPEIAISKRWCMQSALNVSNQIEPSVASLIPAISMTKFKHQAKASTDDKATLSDKAAQGCDDASTGSFHKRLKTNGVVYVRLCCKERAKLVVMSSSEKYTCAKAVFEPLLEKLSQMASIKFCKHLEKWQNAVTESMKGFDVEGCSETSNVEDETDQDSDTDTAMDPADAMETFVMMNEIESEFRFDDLSNLDSSSSTFCQRAVDTLAEKNNADPQSELQVGDTVENLDETNTITSIRKGRDGNVPQSVDIVEGEPRNVDIFQLPPMKQHTRTRQTSKQGWQKQGKRKAIVCYPRNLTVNLSQAVQWALQTGYIKNVKDILDSYPVVMDEPYLKT
ncbi:Zinc finger swim domain-containing protein 3, partial [Globisporangium splendens]